MEQSMDLCQEERLVKFLASARASPQLCLLVSKAILYLGAGRLEVRIMTVPDRGASFTVYQPRFVITARELKWRLRNGNPKGRTGTIENGTEREQIGNIKKQIEDTKF